MRNSESVVVCSSEGRFFKKESMQAKHWHKTLNTLDHTLR